MKSIFFKTTQYIESHQLSKTGSILAIASTIFTVYLTLNALRCFPDILSCGRTWLVLTLPVYILILPLVGKITTSFLLAGFLIISPIYITVSYYIGKNIESLYSKFK
jgi:hypothetical protein